jgi:hypothetical protein
MPIIIKEVIKFDPLGGTIWAEVKCETMLLVAYRVDLREKDSNASVPPFPKEGDNTNSSDDAYALPDPASINDGRRLWLFLTIIDQTGDGGNYKVELELTQGGRTIGTLTTTKKKLTTNFAMEILVALLEAKAGGGL